MVEGRRQSGSVLGLQRSAGNRAVTQLVRGNSLARAPSKVKGGVETKVVSPAVKKLLADKGIPYATEVTFQLLDAQDQVVLNGRFDVVFRTPGTKELIFPELKGDKLDALTKGQKVYVPLFEGKDGAQIRITSKGGGKLVLPTGHVEQVHGRNFLRVGSGNLHEFTAFVEDVSTGKKATNIYYDRGKLLAFHSQAEFDEYLVKEKKLVVQKPPPKPPISATDKPLKPPKPPTNPPPNPLYDPPGGKRPQTTTRWDPTAGPPQGPRKGPNYQPAPVDKPAKLPAPTTGGDKVVKEVGEAAGKAAGKGTVYARVAAKVGLKVLDGLVPDPTDAFALMINFLRSFEEARAAIHQRNLVNGFAIGWAAYLVIPRWEWAKWFAYTVVNKDVITQVLGAVGVAENAFNEGLVRGFIYGEKHSTAQANKARQKAFDALVAKGRMPGRYLGDDEYLFGRDDVFAFAAAMRPAAAEVIKEAERRKAARERAERLEKQQEDLKRRFEAGQTWPR